MTITDFSLLASDEKLELLRKYGVYLFKRRIGNIEVVMYQINKLYVEIFYKKYRHTILKIRCSEDPDILNPYLEEMPMLNFP